MEPESNSSNRDAEVAGDSLNNNPQKVAESMPQQSAATTPPPDKPKLKERIKNLFSKTNFHYKRNRTLASVATLSVIVIFVFAGLFISGNGPWQAKAIEILNVTPTDIDEGIIKNETKFVIEVKNGSVEKVQNAIYLEPAIDYQINERTPGQQYEIVPATTLPDNMVLNIDAVSDNVIDYKWAFQTKKDLSVSKIYPANGANYVSENSVIEISFSYPDVNDVADHFKITPSTEGTLEKLDRTWRFTPAQPLASDATYEITITSGLSYGDEIMSEDFHSSFSTFSHPVASSSTKNKGITLDGVSTFTESENPIVTFGHGDLELLQNADHVTIEKIATADDYIDHLKGIQVASEEIGDYTFEKNEAASSGGWYYAILNQTLPTGYYVFHFKTSSNQNIYTADVEINNLSVYAFESERDMIVWAAENGELKPGIKVNFKDKDYVTGENGILKVENISDYSDTLNYLKIGNTEQPLVIAVTNYKNDLYPQGFIYTDRPLYKSTDTIKVWGYVPLAFFKDAPDRNGFSVIYDAIKQPVAIGEDGFFSSEIALENYKDYTGGLTLNYKDHVLASRYIMVEDYSLENYTYEYIADKNYVKIGENINFKVKVSHITGFPAANKDIVITYDDHDYYGTTNGQGEASFSLPTAYQTANLDSRSSYTVESINIKSGGSDYNKYSNYVTIYIFKNSLDIGYSNDKDAGTVTFTADNLDLNRKVKTSWGFKDLISSPFSGHATITFYEAKLTKSISSYRYDEYTKENVPVYQVDTTTNAIGSTAVDFVNGTVTCNYPNSMKDPEENVRYYYYAVLNTTDPDGHPAYSYNNRYYENNYVGEQSYGYLGNAIEALDYHPNVSYNYNLYRFGLKDRNRADAEYTKSYSPKEYSIGDHLTLGLYDYSENNVKNQGAILAIIYQESIIDANIFTTETLDLEFNRSMYPGANIVGAYFIDGKFHRIAPAYRDYDAEDSRLTINIETDKDSYSPGDIVKAKAIVTRADGSRPDGKINLSVVNEAIFSAYTDNTNLLESIYSNKTFKSYAMSTYQDYTLYGGGGMGSASGGRADFGDTIYFGEKTLSNGEAEFEFKLNDSITSFRLTALTVENGDIINAGVGTTNISSYLPLSITTTMPKKVKSTDDLVLNASSITSSGDSIDYTFTIEELNNSQTATALPGQTVNVNFGKLATGSYTVVISARDSAGNEDKMTYPIEIIETAQEVAVKKTVDLSEVTEITPTKNPIIVEIYSADTLQYLNYLDFLESNRTSRLDTLVAYYKSLEYKNKYYNEEAVVHAPSFADYLHSNGLLKPLLNATGDYRLTALANYYAPDYFELEPSSFGLDISDDNSTAISKLMVLASFKEPVLLDLKNATTIRDLSVDDKFNLALAFMMIGDYDSARDLYEDLYAYSMDQDILAVLATSISKSEAAAKINYLISAKPASDYLDFAIIGFFENNKVDLSTKSEVEITVNNETERINIAPLDIEKRTYYSDDLASLKFKSDAKNLITTYYYQGKISELSSDYANDLMIGLNGDHAVGGTINLTIDISNLTGKARNGELNIALPSSLKFSANFSDIKGLYLIRNNNEYVKLSLSENYTDNFINIPLYIAAPGNYEIEPVVFVHDGNYHLSNNLTTDLQ